MREGEERGVSGGDTPLYKALFCSFTDIYLSIVFVILFFGFGTAQYSSGRFKVPRSSSGKKV